MTQPSSVQLIDTGRCMRCHCKAQKLRYPSADGTMHETWVHVGGTIVARNPHRVLITDYVIEEEP